MSYGEADSHPSGFEQGNTGYSGAPLWKIKQQTAQHQAMVQAAQMAALEEQKKAEDAKKAEHATHTGPRILADGLVSRGKTTGPQLARLVLVKDLRKAAGAMRMLLPTQGIFNDGGGPRALFALFDGHGGDGFGAKAAEHCCRHVLGHVLRNLLSLPSDSCTATFVKAALLKTFEDLEGELAMAQIMERCNASLALIIGDWFFSAVLGRCGAIFCQSPGGEGSAKAGGSATPEPEIMNLRTVAAPAIRTGPVALGTPEVKGVQVNPAERRSFFVLTGVAVAEAVTAETLKTVSNGFVFRPRASAGEIVGSAAGKLRGSAGPMAEADCAAVVGFYRAKEDPDGAPPAKKAKVEQKMDNVRLRHILVRYKGTLKQTADPVKNKPVTRTKEEAEAVLRGALADLLKDGEHTGDKMWAAKSTPRILSICRELSECKSALRGGSNCGDLGWLAKRDLEKMGKDGFDDAVLSLKVAEWSDLLFSDQGIHLVMRIA
eukprot:TRINITY_DN34649_c0_g2_i1.p1 TRINITY_DN34649_c0_g2~~TRINITY_DN34649_c0_g2_i1.p1  ORF type:complete len:489 (-),score=111.74 TRINITY_DN34649_c0_g2_i1:210-1676(-)